MVLIDKVEDVVVGRTRGQALEVDGIVTMVDARGHQPGDFVNVRITEAVEQDLAGVIV